LFFSSFDETITEIGLDAEGLTESELGIVLFLFLGFFVCLFFSPLMTDNDDTSS
jgi:hypothetical protein